MNKHIFKTSDESIELIPQTSEHAHEMFSVLNDSQLNEFTDDKPPESEEWLKDRFKKLESRVSPDYHQFWFNWVVRSIELNCLVGYIQSTVFKDNADMAWVISPSMQKKGYGYKAVILAIKQLREKGNNNFSCHIKPTNVASINLARKVGFTFSNKYEGVEEIWKLS